MFHILVVDDDKNTRMYFEAVLSSSGYTVTVQITARTHLKLWTKST